MGFNENEFIHEQLLLFNSNLIGMVNLFLDNIHEHYIRRNDYDEMKLILKDKGELK